MKRVFVFGALDVENPWVMPRKGEIVIAADKGLLNTEKFNIKPDLIIGDFDSLGFVPQAEKVIKLPVRKDDTDVGYAIKTAMENGADKIFIYGAYGGKADHTFANLQLCAYAAQKGVSVTLLSEEGNATAVTNGELTFKNATGRVSLFAVGEKATGVTLNGFSFPLENGEFSPYYPLGVSNEFKGDTAKITVKNGTVLVLWQENVLPE